MKFKDLVDLEDQHDSTAGRPEVDEVSPQPANVIRYPRKIKKTAVRDPDTGRISHVIEGVLEY